ncbi:MAG: response regulator [Geminicoccaceae bacterium]
MPTSPSYWPDVCRVLVVGDPALSRGLIRLVLSRLDYDVTCVAGVREALAAMAADHYALAVIALQLPDGAGLNLGRRLKALGGPAGPIPVLLFGDTDDEERLLADCRAAQIEGFLPKPVSITRLVTGVRELTRGRARLEPSPPPDDQVPPVELEHFTSFTAGDVQLERELSSLYLATVRVYMDEMGAAPDERAWRSAAHALKGASANIGARIVADLAAEAEYLPPSPEVLERIGRAVEAVRAFFDKRGQGTAKDGAYPVPQREQVPLA